MLHCSIPDPELYVSTPQASSRSGMTEVRAPSTQANKQHMYGPSALSLSFFLPGLGVTNDPQALGPPDHLCCV